MCIYADTDYLHHCLALEDMLIARNLPLTRSLHSGRRNHLFTPSCLESLPRTKLWWSFPFHVPLELMYGVVSSVSCRGRSSGVGLVASASLSNPLYASPLQMVFTCRWMKYEICQPAAAAAAMDEERMCLFEHGSQSGCGMWILSSYHSQLWWARLNK